VSFPLLSTKQKILGIVLDYQEVNLFDSIRMFYNDKEYLLAAVILVFTFIIPVFKYMDMIIRLILNKTSQALQNLDKWNMLDVFLVALLLLNFKMNSSIIVMQLKVGTTFIALAVIFRILAITLTTKFNNK
jgi:uncharacterized paraquat-inducible protein A